MRLLLVEDDEDLATALEKILVNNDYVVDRADSLKLATVALRDNEYDVIVLDRMLPDGDGLELIAYSKKKGLPNRFIVLSALNDLGRKIEGLDLGADDYIAKPFEPAELLVRLRVALRHPVAKHDESIACGLLTYHCGSRDFDVQGEPLMLPRRELVLLEKLIKRFNRVVSREALEDAMYGFDDEILSNSLESHISKLRKNLAKYDTGVMIHTVRGIGYIMKPSL
jgi:DNA-binding response OmpR family regulator